MSARLKEARLDRGLSITAAARQIKVPAETLSRAERGESVPRPSTAKRICDFFGFTVTEIWPVRENGWDGAERRGGD